MRPVEYWICKGAIEVEKAKHYLSNVGGLTCSSFKNTFKPDELEPQLAEIQICE